MPSKVMMAAFNKVIEADGDVEVAIDAAIRAQVDAVAVGSPEPVVWLSDIVSRETMVLPNTLLLLFEVKPE